MTAFTDHLDLIGPDRTADGTVVAIVLVHNEANLLPAFLDHYRAAGASSDGIAFLIVDDRSDDGTADILAAAPDVTVLRPRDNSTYKEHKREWRSQALDRVAAGRWILAPDVDELLVWHGWPSRSLAELIGTLEAESAAALYTVMLDMYADAPLTDHVYHGGSLTDAFPFFDCPTLDPASTWMEQAPSRFRRNWPIPAMHVLGGMRQRLFSDEAPTAMARIARRLHRRWNHRPGSTAHVSAGLWRGLTRSRGAMPPLNLTKVPLVRWQTGLRFYGGAHAMNRVLPLGSERGVLLHFPITRGLEGLEYVTGRGQHADGSAYYRRLLDRAAVSPFYPGSRRLRSMSDLEQIFGTGGPA